MCDEGERLCDTEIFVCLIGHCKELELCIRPVAYVMTR